MYLETREEYSDFIEYGAIRIDFKVCQSHRKTLSIEVYPDQSVKVKAPIITSRSDIKNRIRKKALWIHKKQELFKKLFSAKANKHKGEFFSYLGQQYKLKVEQGLVYKARIENDTLLVTMPVINKSKISDIIDDWYKESVKIVFAERFSFCLNLIAKIKINHSGVHKIRKMKRRWGSCSSQGEITLNYELIKVPKHCIDYVIIHELCHIRQFNHSKEFYILLESVMPDWKIRKQMLNSFANFEYFE